MLTLIQILQHAYRATPSGLVCFWSVSTCKLDALRAYRNNEELATHDLGGYYCSWRHWKIRGKIHICCTQKNHARLNPKPVILQVLQHFESCFCRSAMSPACKVVRVFTGLGKVDSLGWRGCHMLDRGQHQWSSWRWSCKEGFQSSCVLFVSQVCHFWTWPQLGQDCMRCRVWFVSIIAARKV